MAQLEKKVDDDKFAGRVKAIRTRLKMKQKDFGKKLDISVTTLSEIENNKSKPGYEFFYNMVRELNVNLNYLLYGEGPMFRDIEAESVETRKGDSAGFPFDLKRLGYKAGNEAVDEFLYYFFNSRYVHYHFLSEFVRFFTQDKDIIKNEIASLKDNKEPVP